MPATSPAVRFSPWVDQIPIGFGSNGIRLDRLPKTWPPCFAVKFRFRRKEGQIATSTMIYPIGFAVMIFIFERNFCASLSKHVILFRCEDRLPFSICFFDFKFHGSFLCRASQTPSVLAIILIPLWFLPAIVYVLSKLFTGLIAYEKTAIKSSGFSQ